MMKNLIAMGIDDDTFRWVVGCLIGIICSIGGFWMSHLTDGVGAMAVDISEHSQRISVLEANVQGVDRRLDRIEGKIDYLIQGKLK